MTRTKLFRSFLGVAAAVALTLSLGACMSNGGAMKSKDSSMDNTTKTSKMTDSTMSSNTMNSDTSGNTMSK